MVVCLNPNADDYDESVVRYQFSFVSIFFFEKQRTSVLTRDICLRPSHSQCVSEIDPTNSNFFHPILFSEWHTHTWKILCVLTTGVEPTLYDVTVLLPVVQILHHCTTEALY